MQIQAGNRSHNNPPAASALACYKEEVQLTIRRVGAAGRDSDGGLEVRFPFF